jgi:two-component system sensor histidine kinase CpxA
MAFFWRILVSAWAILLIAIFATYLAVGWLSQPGNGGDDVRFGEQMVDLIARELRHRLAIDPTTAAEFVASEQELDFAPMLTIYVIDPAGNDVLGRTLPEAIAEVIGSPIDRSPESIDRAFTHLHIRAQGLDGYRVVGDEGFFLMRGLLMTPGARGLLIAFIVLVSAAMSAVLARFVVLPVRQLRLAGQQVADGDLSVRVAPTVGKRTDDIARLAQDFDVMTERVNALLQSQQRLMRDVSHELRSPLARLQALLSIARQTADTAGAEQIDRMESELERLDELIGEILAFTRLEAKAGIERHPTDVADLVQNIVDDASLEGQAAGKEILLQGPERLVVDLDSRLVQSAVENVVRNALKYTAEGTTVVVKVVDESKAIRIIIDDRGPGVPEEAIGKIFEPFFRVEDSRGTRSGTGGIGLAIAERSIRLHGGAITASNRDGGGLRVELAIPSICTKGDTR